MYHMKTIYLRRQQKAWGPLSFSCSSRFVGVSLSGLERDLHCPPIAAGAYLRQLAHGINTALHMAGDPASARRSRVYSATLVRGRQFYGFQATDKLFIRVCKTSGATHMRAVLTGIREGRDLGTRVGSTKWIPESGRFENTKSVRMNTSSSL
jgi:hypothetical protein